LTAGTAYPVVGTVISLKEIIATFGRVLGKDVRYEEIIRLSYVSVGSFASDVAEQSGCALPKCSKTGPYSAPARNLPSHDGRKR
jgi:hypothetical protein